MKERKINPFIFKSDFAIFNVVQKAWNDIILKDISSWAMSCPETEFIDVKCHLRLLSPYICSLTITKIFLEDFLPRFNCSYRKFWEKNKTEYDKLLSIYPDGLISFNGMLHKSFSRLHSGLNMDNSDMHDPMHLFTLKMDHASSKWGWVRHFKSYRAMCEDSESFFERHLKAIKGSEEFENVSSIFRFCFLWDYNHIPMRYWSDKAVYSYYSSNKKSNPVWNGNTFRNTCKMLNLKPSKTKIVLAYYPGNPGEIELDSAAASKAGLSWLLDVC